MPDKCPGGGCPRLELMEPLFVYKNSQRPHEHIYTSNLLLYEGYGMVLEKENIQKEFFQGKLALEQPDLKTVINILDVLEAGIKSQRSLGNEGSA